jgi:hypothetical protein
MTGNCPYSEFLFDNLLRTSTGAYRCLVQGLQPEDVNYKTFDYMICKESNHKECSLFLLKKLEKISKNVK